MSSEQMERLADRMRHAIEVDGTNYRHIDGMVVASWADELRAYTANMRQAARLGVPDEADDEFVPRWWDSSHGDAYKEGWNDCRIAAINLAAQLAKGAEK